MRARCQDQYSGGTATASSFAVSSANTDSKREIVGLHIGPSEAETFWATFLKSMVRRGLRGVKLVIADAHEGLKAAIRRAVGTPGNMPREAVEKSVVERVTPRQQC